MEEKVSYIRKLRVTVDYCGLIATIMLIATIALTDSRKHRAATIPRLCKGDENSPQNFEGTEMQRIFTAIKPFIRVRMYYSNREACVLSCLTIFT